MQLLVLCDSACTYSYDFYDSQNNLLSHCSPLLLGRTQYTVEVQSVVH